jgi:hypothetical protein
MEVSQPNPLSFRLWQRRLSHQTPNNLRTIFWVCFSSDIPSMSQDASVVEGKNVPVSASFSKRVDGNKRGVWIDTEQTASAKTAAGKPHGIL